MIDVPPYSVFLQALHHLAGHSRGYKYANENYCQPSLTCFDNFKVYCQLINRMTNNKKQHRIAKYIPYKQQLVGSRKQQTIPEDTFLKTIQIGEIYNGVLECNCVHSVLLYNIIRLQEFQFNEQFQSSITKFTELVS